MDGDEGRSSGSLWGVEIQDACTNDYLSNLDILYVT